MAKEKAAEKKNVNVTLREMTPDDWDSVVDIYMQGLKTGIATFQTTYPSYLDWDRAHLPYCRTVAEKDGKVLGWIALSPVSARVVYSGVQEVSIYVATDARGLGIGTKLMKRCIEESEVEGIWTLQSAIFEVNAASLKLHKNCGFREVGYREKIARDYQGNWQNTILVERRTKVDPSSSYEKKAE